MLKLDGFRNEFSAEIHELDDISDEANGCKGFHYLEARANGRSRSLGKELSLRVGAIRMEGRRHGSQMRGY